MRRRSIRFRITAVAVAAVVVVLTGVSVALVVAQRFQLTAALDSSLRQRAEDITALLEPANAAVAEFGSSREDGFVQLIGGDGVVIAASPNLAGYQAISSPYALGGPESLVTISGLPIDDDPFRMLSRTVRADGSDAVLHVGTTYEVVGESTEALTSSLALVVPIVVLLLAALIWWLVGRTLRPVEDIRSQVASIGPGDLDRRVTEPATGDEIALLAGTMNQMLERVQAAVTRQERFVADASHELRSPLTRMRSEIEVDLAERDEPDQESLRSLLAEVVELQQLVDDLLHLARSDAGQAEMALHKLDIDDLVLEEGRLAHSAGRVVVDMSAVSGAQVAGDRRQLQRAIHNIVDNAIRHAESRLQLQLQEAGGMAELVVADDGPGIPEPQMERVFERFARADDSRARASGGSGLGLAIARDIARRHGGELTLEPLHTGQARFVMRIPLA